MRGVAAQGTTSIEHEFERIVGEARDSEIIRRQLAAVRFYLHDVIEESTQGYAMEAGHGVTNYHALVSCTGDN